MSSLYQELLFSSVYGEGFVEFPVRGLSLEQETQLLNSTSTEERLQLIRSELEQRGTHELTIEQTLDTLRTLFESVHYELMLV